MSYAVCKVLAVMFKVLRLWRGCCYHEMKDEIILRMLRWTGRGLFLLIMWGAMLLCHEVWFEVLGCYADVYELSICLAVMLWGWVMLCTGLMLEVRGRWADVMVLYFRCGVLCKDAMIWCKVRELMLCDGLCEVKMLRWRCEMVCIYGYGMGLSEIW
jgi:hypothetical protein